MRIEGSVLGPFKTEVKLDYQGGAQVLELRATVVSQSLEVILPDGSSVLENIHYGSIYFGQERQFTALIVNNGPHPSSFSTTIESKTEDEEILVYFNEMSVDPPEGTLDPLSKMEITFKFNPIEIDPQIEQLLNKTLRSRSIFGPVRDYSRTISFGVIETGQTIDILGTGRVSASIITATDFYAGASS